MKWYTVKWQKKDKYLPLQRNTLIEANSESDAKAAFHKEFGSERQIEILEITEGA